METESWCRRDDSSAHCCITGTEKLVFLLTNASDRQHVNPESLVLALNRFTGFLVEKGVTSLSSPVYDPNRGKLHPREQYALVHVIF